MTVAGLLVMVVVAQNTETVEVRLLFSTLAMPRAVLLGGAVLVGFVMGVVVARQLVRGKPASRSE